MSNNALPHPSQVPIPVPKLECIPVFYTPLMVAQTGSFSPSAAKPKAAVASWLKLGIVLSIIAPEPATFEDIARAHLPDFVDAVLSCRSANGFGNRSKEVAASLPYTSGAMLAAAREALRNGRVAAAPCSGFHHAGYSNANGFCTFNGLMVTAMALHASGEVKRVGILDFDQHYGDGTDDIIDHLRIDWVEHFTAGRHFHLSAEAGRHGSSTLDRRRIH